MELQLPFSLLLMVTILFLLSLIKLNMRTKHNNVPPGPWKLPIIGSMHHLATGCLPQYTLSKLSNIYGPLMHLKLGEISAVVVSSPEIAKSFLRTHDLDFGGRPSTLATDIMSYNKSGVNFTPQSDYWRQMRKICSVELLSNKHMKSQSFSFIREDEVSKLVAFVGRSVGSPINFSAQIFSLTSSVTCRAAFDEEFLGKSSLISLVNEATSLMGGFNLGDFFPSISVLSVVSGMKNKMQKTHKKIDMMLDEIIKKRLEYYNLGASKRGDMGDGKEDLLDVLLRLKKRNEHEFPITDTNIKAVILVAADKKPYLDMFIAGTETSAAIIEWAMCEMIKNPRVMEKAQSELRLNHNKNKNVGESDKHGLHYLKLVIKETLRLHPPLPLVGRECTKPCETDGYSIPVKCRVLVNVWAMGRDPKFWEDAEKFIPERFEENRFEYNGNNFEYIPFGAGRRICPGISFGLATVELVLAQLLYHFNWKLPNQIKPEELDMTETTGITAKKRNPLYLIANFNEAMLVEN